MAAIEKIKGRQAKRGYTRERAQSEKFNPFAQLAAAIILQAIKDAEYLRSAIGTSNKARERHYHLQDTIEPVGWLRRADSAAHDYLRACGQHVERIEV